MLPPATLPTATNVPVPLVRSTIAEPIEPRGILAQPAILRLAPAGKLYGPSITSA